MLPAMTRPATILIAGSPTALGGHFAGMEQGPGELRAHGLLERLGGRPGLAGATFIDHGDAVNEPGWAPDPSSPQASESLASRQARAAGPA